jgi:alpha,alpha-trehalase
MFKLLKNNGNSDELSQQNIAKAYNYVVDYWPIITRHHTQSTDTFFGLPHPYIVPANQHGNFRFNEQYYWDSYFIALGLIAAGKNEVAEGMLENLFYMFKHYKMIPNASRIYMISRS